MDKIDGEEIVEHREVARHCEGGGVDACGGPLFESAAEVLSSEVAVLVSGAVLEAFDAASFNMPPPTPGVAAGCRSGLVRLASGGKRP